MGPAWQVRESQREELIRGLFTKVCEAAFVDESIESSTILFKIIQVLIGHLDPKVLDMALIADPDLAFLHTEIFYPIGQFTQFEEEKRLIIAKLIIKVTETALNSISGSYQEKEPEILQETLGASSPMDEVELPVE